MDTELILAEDGNELADIERLEQVYSNLQPMKTEVFTSSSEDEYSEDDYEEFMNKPENETDQVLIQQCTSGTHEDSSLSENAEDPRQDLDEGDASNEPTLENCYYLNHVYQDLIHESIEDIELLLKLNKENQATVNDKIASKKPTNTRPMKSFTFPYFKDADFHMPPPNQDTKIKMVNGEVISNVCQKKPWSESERKRLVNAIKSNSMEKALQAVMSRKEIILMELSDNTCTLTAEKIAEKMKTLKEKEIEMEFVQNSVKQNPIGPIDADYDWLKISVVNFEGERSALECEVFWKNYLHPSINKSKWSKEEVVKLAESVKQLGHHSWEAIASLFKTNRTALQCFEKYQISVYKDNLKGKWTTEEQERLKHLVDTFRIGDYIPWYRVCYFMEGRTGEQVLHHWQYQLNPSIKKGRWTEEEDLLLLSAVWMLGPRNWWKIRDYVPGRTCSQCRDRWTNILNPVLQCTNWKSEEDTKILELVNIHGKKWSLIAHHMHGRSCTSVKSRYRSLTQHTMEDNSLSKHSEVGFASYARNQAVYRTRIYRRLISTIRFYVKTQRGAASELLKYSQEALINTISALAVASMSRSRKYERHPLDKEVSDLMCRLSVDDLKEMFKKKRTKKSHAGTVAVEKELDEYFRTANQKKKRGRPHKIVEIPEDDPKCKNWTEKYTEIIRSCTDIKMEDSKLQAIPFLPPMTRSLQAFRGILLRSKSLQALPMSRIAFPLSAEENGQASNQNSNPYELLFSRFASLFFWPALLSLIKPEDHKTEPKMTKRKRIQQINEKYRKRHKAKAAANNDITEESDLTAKQSCTTATLEDEESQVMKKKLGRPRKVKSQGTSNGNEEMIPTRRSTRLCRNDGKAGT